MINSLCMNQVCVKGMTVGKFQCQAIKIPPLSVDNDDLSDNGDAGQRLTCRQPSCLDPFTLCTRGFLSCFFLVRPSTACYANIFFERFSDDSFLKSESLHRMPMMRKWAWSILQREEGGVVGEAEWGSCVFFTPARSKWRPASTR